jgi:hypothetical protein
VGGRARPSRLSLQLITTYEAQQKSIKQVKLEMTRTEEKIKKGKKLVNVAIRSCNPKPTAKRFVLFMEVK